MSEINQPNDTKEHKLKVVEPAMQYITFILDEQTYAVNVMQVREVIKYSKVSLVPGAPAYVHGIINLRGEVITVIDMRQRFGLAATSIQPQTKIMIMQAEDQVLGIMVDNVTEVIELHRGDIEAVPQVGEHGSMEFVDGVCEHNATKIVIIDLNKLLTEAEWQELSRL